MNIKQARQIVDDDRTEATQDEFVQAHLVLIKSGYFRVVKNKKQGYSLSVFDQTFLNNWTFGGGVWPELENTLRSKNLLPE